MAHLELPVRGGYHVTLVHFEDMTDERLALVEEAMAVIQRRVTKPPVATWGKTAKLGRYRNVPGALVVGAYIPALRAGIVKELDARGVPYSEDFSFTPHVTKAGPIWDEGKPIPILPWVDLVWKDKVKLHFELA